MILIAWAAHRCSGTPLRAGNAIKDHLELGSHGTVARGGTLCKGGVGVQADSLLTNDLRDNVIAMVLGALCNLGTMVPWVHTGRDLREDVMVRVPMQRRDGPRRPYPCVGTVAASASCASSAVHGVCTEGQGWGSTDLPGRSECTAEGWRCRRARPGSAQRVEIARRTPASTACRLSPSHSLTGGTLQ